jgi:hypothetical protein
MNTEITGSKSTYSRCSGTKGHEGQNWLLTYSALKIVIYEKCHKILDVLM